MDKQGKGKERRREVESGRKQKRERRRRRIERGKESNREEGRKGRRGEGEGGHMCICFEGLHLYLVLESQMLGSAYP
jgi:hypothetical protein